MKKKLVCNFEDIIGVDNLLEAWREFVKGKRAKPDVQAFSLRLMDNILALHHDLAHYTYRHGAYQAFRIADPKPRCIHKASVRDRLLHHAVYRKLYPFFDHTFIADSFSCRIGKGTHKALNRFRSLAYKASKNHTKTCWVLKCDIKQFFASIDHDILINTLRQYITADDILWLLSEIITSFSSTVGKGLPLGNVTSQLFANVYMSEFDQFVKHRLKARYYIRYTDDFVLLSADREWITKQEAPIKAFLQNQLRLSLHRNTTLKTLASGVDFLGWVHFPDHRVLRQITKRRMLQKINACPHADVMNSYIGLLRHGNTHLILYRF